MKGDPNHRDESGNIRLPSVGTYLKQKINAYFESKGEKANIKYHDPSYMIRSVKANASDAVMCNILAENAVHGAMAGFTGFTSGLVNHRRFLSHRCRSVVCLLACFVFVLVFVFVFVGDDNKC
mmetsp:Transcript_18819/g.31033  ORF Transcript_18819/g.31033 Transcript_18819/m.31033 type:complete len:123 (-) Transcript_18819:268-636(-)